MTRENDRHKGVAIIGMAGRFPGAPNISRFWENLCNGVESIHFFSEEDAISAGAPPELVKHPDYVKAWGTLEDMELFDANFFGIPGREAEAMDPQHRHYLEVAGAALEDAGYNPETYDGYIGAVSGVGISSYLVRNILPNSLRMQALGEFQVFLGNDKDFMPTRLSYKLDLRGGSHSVSTGCSTTMVATHLACQSLLTYQNDICLAGGANIKVPQKLGYLYKKGELKSPDGHCRAFDSKARGTVFSNGCAVVVLKRLKEALADGDHIYAVIKGSAINNDGAGKAGFTAPSVSGQARVIAEAHDVAGFPADTITYMEAHGTGTELGDPIEIKALNQVFRETTDRKQYCAMASVKTNVGHLDNVAGVTGLIKTALCLKHRQIPASLHFEKPNPEIDFANSPFYINTRLQEWNPPPNTPRRACVSAFGAGGTNAHAVLEESPTRDDSGTSRPWQLLCLSAKTETALTKIRTNLARHLRGNQGLKWPDVAFTLNSGRRYFSHRLYLVAHDLAEAEALLADDASNRVFTGVQNPDAKQDATNTLRFMDALGVAKDDQAMCEALTGLGEHWLHGGTIDWSEFYAGERRFRVPLPTYPYEGKRYWVDQPKTGLLDVVREAPQPQAPDTKKPNMADWFYTPSWRLAPLPRLGPPPKNGDDCWIVFCDELGIGRQFSEAARTWARELVLVRPGKEFQKIEENNYVLDPLRPEDYNGMLSELQNLGKNPEAVVHIWTLTEQMGEDQNPNKHRALDFGYESLQNLANAIHAQSYEKTIRLLVVSNFLQFVLEGDRLSPEKASLLGPVRVIPQEYPNILCRSIDVEWDDSSQKPSIISQLVAECVQTTTGGVVAYRGGQRWLQSFEPVRIQASHAAQAPLEQGGIYLITGGLGGIGLELAKHLADKYRAKLVLTGRSGLPDRRNWEEVLEFDDDQAVVSKIQAVLAMEEAGAEVMTPRADATSLEDMKKAVEAGERTFGPIQGVIHAAGVADVGLIKRRKPGSGQAVLSPKMKGSLVLGEIFQERDPDFLVLYSSLAAVMGGYGQVSYVAANNFLDSYAQSRKGRKPRVISINWDAWREAGMAVKRQSEHLQRTGLLSAEGVVAFERVLGSGLSRVLISTYDIETRIRKAAEWNVDNEGTVANRDTLDKPTYPRPQMSEPYLAPRDNLEEALAETWRDLFGMEKIGVHDDFFELGGDSLKGMNLINRFEKQLDAAFHIDALFDLPTIAGLSRYLRENYPESVARMLGEQPILENIALEDRIESGQINELRALIPSLSDSRQPGGPQNRRAVFLLAPPRSGTTLLRVMLAGNPGLFAPPELFLLSFNTFQERKAAFPEKSAFWLEGLTHSVMQIKGCSEQFAESILLDWEERDFSTKHVYAEIQGWLGDRLLVDKTPSYAYDPAVLQKAEKDFRQPLYIHLKRHPYGMIRSYEAAKMDLLLRHFAGKKLTHNSRQIGEMMWFICHRNILDFLADIPRERRHDLTFEDLVENPENAIRNLCEFLQVAYHEDMLHPYKETNARMTEGIRTGAKMLGDMNFHAHQTIDPRVAEKWKRYYKTEFLGVDASALAQTLGYRTTISETPSKENGGVPGYEEIRPLARDQAVDLAGSVDQMSDEEIEEQLRQLSEVDR